MKPQPKPSSREVLAGVVERVTYHNDGSGCCVLRIKARGHRELVTVVGHATVMSAGESITASGEWVNNLCACDLITRRFNVGRFQTWSVARFPL
jgi:exodeoxyribonuclease V alpha subunit